MLVADGRFSYLLVSSCARAARSGSGQAPQTRPPSQAQAGHYAPGAANGSSAPSACASGTTLPADGPLYQAAVYSGVESLAGMNKVYMNVALGFENPLPAGTTCAVSFSATADDGNDPVIVAGAVPVGSIYAYIRYDVPNVASCVGNKALDGSTEVRTEYTSPTAPGGTWKGKFDGIERSFQITKLCAPGAGYLSAMGPGCGVEPLSRATAWLDFESGSKVAPGSSTGDLAIDWISSSATFDPQNGAAIATTDISITQFHSVECSATDGRSYLAWPANAPGVIKVVCLRTGNGEYFKLARHVPIYGVAEILWASGAPTGKGGFSSLTVAGAPQEIPTDFNCQSGYPSQRYISADGPSSVSAVIPAGYLQGGPWGHSTGTGVGVCSTTFPIPCLFFPSGQDFLSLPNLTLNAPTGHVEAVAYADAGLTLRMSYTCSNSANDYWNCGRACAGLVPVDCTVTVAVVDGYQGRNLVWGNDCSAATGTSCSYKAHSGSYNYATVGFTSPNYAISVTVNGGANSGMVYFDVPGVSVETLPAAGVRNFQAPLHSVVRLTAMPGNGNPFPGWASGPCVGQGPRCAFEVSGDSDTVVQFAQ